MNHNYKTDLRVFGAIGFQDAPNGLWLGIHKLPRESILQRIVDSATKRKTRVIALTSEDNLMLPYSPEDRFGFVKSLTLPHSYDIHEVERGVLRVHKNSTDGNNGGVVYIVNAETRGPQLSKELWLGLKLQIVGGNLIPKDLGLEDTVKYANDKGYGVFIMNASTPQAKELADRVINNCLGVIGHDATKALPYILSRFSPNNDKSNNDDSINYAESRGKPWIAVSSAHWTHEIGNANFKFIENGTFSLEKMFKAIRGGRIKNERGYNKLLDIIRFGRLLSKHGGDPDRFIGDDLSSYTR